MKSHSLSTKTSIYLINSFASLNIEIQLVKLAESNAHRFKFQNWENGKVPPGNDVSTQEKYSHAHDTNNNNKSPDIYARYVHASIQMNIQWRKKKNIFRIFPKHFVFQKRKKSKNSI